MNILGIPILTLVTFFPVAGMIVVLALPGSRTRAIKLAANIFTGLELVATMLLLTRFDASSGDMQLLERAPWIKAIGAQYLLGVDGISLLLVLLTSLLTFIATLSSWQAIEKRLKEYYVFLLLLETGMIGVFLALDLLLFYVFWEVVLVPM
ncbi:MAG: proton-translocating NADH-quinone oxidoreductase, chain, partial [Candidatus Aminicenantes bacterium]|nr:proton-translocating NADH-quinone oxidoreductase, chain [Candidatus Aminicenantes bacterium]